MIFSWSIKKIMCDTPTLRPPSKMATITIIRNFKCQKRNLLVKWQTRGASSFLLASILSVLQTFLFFVFRICKGECLINYILFYLTAVREDRMPGGRNSGAVYNLYKVCNLPVYIICLGGNRLSRSKGQFDYCLVIVTHF
jgi:hypothetical protein